MLSKNVFFEEMVMIESIYAVRVVTLPENTEQEKSFKKTMRNRWYEAFKHIPDNVFTEGCNKLIMNHKYDSVKPVHIVDYCKDVLKDTVTSEDKAWNEVLQSFKNFHPKYETAEANEFYSKEVREIIHNLGGFQRVSATEGKNMTFLERDFKKMYKEMIMSAVNIKISKGENLLDFNSVKMIEG